MCLRVFLSSESPLCPNDRASAQEGATPPDFSLGPVGPDAQSVVRRLGGYVYEAGAHGGSACGFSSSLVAFTTGESRRSAIAGLEGALVRGEREDLLGRVHQAYPPRLSRRHAVGMLLPSEGRRWLIGTG